MLQPENYYLLRTPLFPAVIAENLLKIQDKCQLHHEIKKICNTEKFKEAVYLASPVLYYEMEKLFSGKNDSEKEDRLFNSLLKYIIRASTRSTPFGMFSGVSLGQLTEITQIQINNPIYHNPKIRLDMGFLNEIIENLLILPEIKNVLKYYPNNSYYMISDKLNYFEKEVLKNINTYNLSSVDASKTLIEIIKASEKGLKKSQLYRCIDDDEFEQEEIESFINELIENQILVTNMGSSITGDNALLVLINKLDSLQEDNPDNRIKNIIQQLKNIYEILNSEELLKNKQKLITEILESLFGVKEFKNNLFQVDLLVDTYENKINSSIITKITKQIVEVMTTTKTPEIPDLKKFKDDFRNRYEKQELPLMQVLDNEYGIGYGNSYGHLMGNSPLISEVSGGNEQEIYSNEFTKYDKFLHEKIYDATRRNLNIIELTSDDIGKLSAYKKRENILPNSLYILGSLILDNSGEKEFQFLLNTCNGPTSSTVMTRFCHMDESLAEKISQSIIEEESEDESKVLAEIIHSPQANLGNIIHRPVMRDYEIPFISTGGQTEDRQIKVNDLYVSLENDEIILRSKKLNKRIIPRLTTAHNFTFASIPVYKFLCDLQSQGMQCSYSWSWTVFSDLPYLPRVIYKNIILSPAKWNIKKPINELPFILVEKFVKEYKLPQFVIILEGDNGLLVNTETKIGLETISKYLAKSEIIMLQEYLVRPENSIVKNIENQEFIHEVVIPIHNKKKESFKKNTLKKSQFETLKREFTLGNEWLYVKLYGGAKILDNIVLDDLQEIIEFLKAKEIIDKWFFIRYNDPDWHIRIRFRLVKDADYRIIISTINNFFEDYIHNNTIFKIQYDTYQRELERYLGNTIVHSEEIFSIDSTYALSLLEHIKHNNEDLRWLIAIKSVDEYFNYFEFTTEQKIIAANALAKKFYPEFGNPGKVQKSLNVMYRKYSTSLNQFFNNEMFKKEKHSVINTIFNMRKSEISSVIQSIKKDFQPQVFANVQDQLLPSFIHMSINRFFPSYQRKYEMIIYHFLGKYINSLHQRNKKEEYHN